MDLEEKKWDGNSNNKITNHNDDGNDDGTKDKLASFNPYSFS